MKNAMVAYFSASGVTAKVARRLAKAIDADLFEIRPETPYTRADLNWMDKKSRSTLEMNDPSCRPAMAQVPDVSAYDVIFVGFPIWWYREPSIIDSFMESADFTGKTVVPFCTSGGSGIGDSAQNMQALARGAVVKKGRRFSALALAGELKKWAGQWL
ncbi:MAG TPA: flavodoxin [Sarcina sp.]|jgi:flavodoxin|nr:flavodoxin [Sarcina sp.]